MPNTVETTHSPPHWLVQQQLAGVIERRLGTAARDYVRDLTATTADRLRFHFEASQEYALVSLHPPAEENQLRMRIKRFGQAFPGLFNIDGIPRPHDLRMDAQPKFIGGVKTRSATAPLLLGAKDFSSTIVTDCFLSIVHDTSAALARLTIRSGPHAARKFRYKLYFIFTMAFGERISIYDFADGFERTVTRYFGPSAGDSFCQQINDELAVTGHAA